MTKRRITLLVSAVIVLIVGVGLAGFALAGPSGVPGPITGLVSPSHPDEATWYDDAGPSFAWDPVAANGAAIVGYSYVLDQDPGTVPDLSSERLSLDFLGRVTYTTGARPTEVRVGDLDSDGNEDVVTANATGDNVSVLMGNGDGTFDAKVDYAMNDQPWSLQLGDFDHDGDLDIVTGDLRSNQASVRLNNGNGTFAARVGFTTGRQPECLRIGDVNNDTHLDIVTSNATDNTVSVLRGRGDGTFHAKLDFATSVHPTSIDIGDLNDDGDQDLIAANTGPSTVSVLLGNGDGTFGAKTDYATGSTPYTVIVADVNGDGNLDVETVNNAADSASILMGNGDGTLDAKVDYAVGDSPYALDVRDLNQDGAADLVTTNNGANTASILMGNGDGTFTTKTDYATGSGPFWVTLGDFDNDGYGDLVSTDYASGANTVSVRLGTAYLAVGFTGKADGIWYFHVRALDSYGDGGATSTRMVRIDTQAPTTTQSGADDLWHDADVTVTFSGSDAGSGVAGTEYRIDGGEWTTGTEIVVPAPSDGSNDGEHTIEYRSTDAMGHVETAKSCQVKIVTQAPTTTVSGADELWHDSDVTLDFSSGSPGDPVVEYRVDGGEWVTGTQAVIPASPDGSNDGEHTIEYRSTNALGMVEDAKSVTVKIDVGAPTTSVSGADETWHDSDVTLDFSASDAGSGVALTEYQIDGGGWVTLVGGSLVIPASPDGSNDGEHTIEYRSTDAMGHVEDAKSVTVKIDVGAPTTSVSGGDDLWHDGDVTLDFSASDAGSGVATTEYRLDGGEWVELVGGSLVIPASPDGSNDGEHTIEYRSTDAIGHVETAKSVTVKIDVAAPTTTQSGADDLWHDADVTVTFSGSDAGSGVAGTEYRIDGGEWTIGTEIVVPAPSDGSNDGVHTIEYRSTDAMGHVETAKSCQVKIGHLETTARYVRHKLSVIAVTWPSVPGAVTYEILINGTVRGTTSDLWYAVWAPSREKGVTLTVEVIARDGSGTQLWIDGREQPWRM